MLKIYEKPEAELLKFQIAEAITTGTPGDITGSESVEDF